MVHRAFHELFVFICDEYIPLCRYRAVICRCGRQPCPSGRSVNDLNCHPCSNIMVLLNGPTVIHHWPACISRASFFRTFSGSQFCYDPRFTSSTTKPHWYIHNNHDMAIKHPAVYQHLSINWFDAHSSALVCWAVRAHSFSSSTWSMFLNDFLELFCAVFAISAASGRFLLAVPTTVTVLLPAEIDCPLATFLAVQAKATNIWKL